MVDSNQFYQDLFNTPQYQMGGTPTGLNQQQMLSSLVALSNAIGIPLTELTGQDIANTPIQPSLQKQVYGSNPIFRDMFAYMDAGDDPMVAFNKVKKNQEDNKAYGEDVDFSDEDTSAKFFKIAEDYKFETAKNQSDAAGTYTTASGKKYQGSGDVFSEKSMYELMGAPDEETLIKEVARSKQPSNISTKGLFNNMFKNDPLAGLHPSFVAALKRNAGGKLEQAKSTMVQSDAQRNAVQKILALKNLINPIPSN